MHDDSIFSLTCIGIYVISYAMPSVWYIWTFNMLMTISTDWIWFTRLFFLCDQPSKASHRMDLFVYMKCWNIVNINVLMTPELFWGRKETLYLSVIVDNGTLRLASDIFAAFYNWLLPKTQRHIKSFVHFVLIVIVLTINRIVQHTIWLV